MSPRVYLKCLASTRKWIELHCEEHGQRKGKQDYPFLVLGSRKEEISCSWNYTPIHSQCNIQEWLKQLLSPAPVRRNVPLFWQGVNYSLVCLQCRNAEPRFLRYSGCDWAGVDLAVPAAVEGVFSQKGVIQQAGLGTVSVALVFSCCQLHVNALTCSLEKV